MGRLVAGLLRQHQLRQGGHGRLCLRPEYLEYPDGIARTVLAVREVDSEAQRVLYAILEVVVADFSGLVANPPDSRGAGLDSDGAYHIGKFLPTALHASKALRLILRFAQLVDPSAYALSVVGWLA